MWKSELRTFILRAEAVAKQVDREVWEREVVVVVVVSPHVHAVLRCTQKERSCKKLYSTRGAESGLGRRRAASGARAPERRSKLRHGGGGFG
eukprot:238435-Prymnesium_polylepis.1